MMKKGFSILAVSLVSCLLLAGCGLDITGTGLPSGSRSFIDAPLSETEWVVGLPIAITTHANFDVSRILVNVTKEPNDPAFRQVLEIDIREVTPGIYQSDMYWTPDETGRYKLMAFSYTGSRFNDWDSWTTHTIYINVTEMPEDGRGGEAPSPTPLPTAPAAQSAQAPWVDLWADQYSLAAGACTTLRWDAQHVEQLLLNGEAVAFSGSRQVCPGANTTYTLRGSSAAGQAETSVAISVSVPAAPVEPPPPQPPEPPAPPPADISGPTLGNLQLSAAKVFDNPACGADSVTLSIKVQDPGGIARVELHYRARTGSATGVWRVKNMSSGSGGNFTAVLSGPDFASSLAAYTPGRVDVLVKAWDSAGNLSQSAQLSFETDYCLL